MGTEQRFHDPVPEPGSFIRIIGIGIGTWYD